MTCWKHAKRYIAEECSRHYGYGFEIDQVRKTMTIGHGGVDAGVGSRFWILSRNWLLCNCIK